MYDPKWVEDWKSWAARQDVGALKANLAQAEIDYEKEVALGDAGYVYAIGYNVIEEELIKRGEL